MKATQRIVKRMSIGLLFVLTILLYKNAQSQIGQTCPPCNDEKALLKVADDELEEATNLLKVAQSNYDEANADLISRTFEIEFYTQAEKNALNALNIATEILTGIEKSKEAAELLLLNPNISRFAAIAARWAIRAATVLLPAALAAVATATSAWLAAKAALAIRKSALDQAKIEFEQAIKALIFANSVVVKARLKRASEAQKLADCIARGTGLPECFECVSGKIELKKGYKLCNGVCKPLRSFVRIIVTNCYGVGQPNEFEVEYPQVPPTPGTFGKLTRHYGENGVMIYCEGEETVITVTDITCED